MEGEEGRQESERPGKRRAILQRLKNRWLPFWREVIYIYKVDEPLLEFVWRKDNEIWGTGEEERIFLNGDTREGFRGNFSRGDVCRTITLLDELLLSLKNGYRFIDRDNLCDEDILLLPYINIA